ncbi:hypothetical protein [Microcystis aeruginosa]|nr:hypothetical protein [Microcystis aeruginosa]
MSGIIILLGEEFLIKTKVIDDRVKSILVHFCVSLVAISVGLFSSQYPG